jgi:hypothetical protein
MPRADLAAWRTWVNTYGITRWCLMPCVDQYEKIDPTPTYDWSIARFVGLMQVTPLGEDYVDVRCEVDLWPEAVGVSRAGQTNANIVWPGASIIPGADAASLHPACQPYACDAIASVYGDSSLNGWFPVGTTKAAAYPISSGLDLTAGGARWGVVADTTLGDGCNNEGVVLYTDNTIGAQGLARAGDQANFTGPINISFIAKNYGIGGTPAISKAEIIRNDLRGRLSGTTAGSLPGPFDQDFDIDWTYFMHYSPVNRTIDFIVRGSQNTLATSLSPAPDFPPGGDVELTIGTIDVSDNGYTSNQLYADWFLVNFSASIDLQLQVLPRPGEPTSEYYTAVVTYASRLEVAYLDTNGDVQVKSVSSSDVAYPAYVRSTPTTWVDTINLEFYPGSPFATTPLYLVDNFGSRFAGIYFSVPDAREAFTAILRNRADYELPSFC